MGPSSFLYMTPSLALILSNKNLTSNLYIKQYINFQTNHQLLIKKRCASVNGFDVYRN